MTTFVNFAPNSISPFQFQATLDGQVYNVVVTWNLFGKRYYVNVYALDGTLVISTALVGSPTGLTLEALSWRSGAVTATASAPHGYQPTRTVDLTITGASPDAYNGKVAAYVTGPETFTYPLASDPGAAAAFGAATFNISLVSGLFASTLIYREATRQFEISP